MKPFLLVLTVAAALSACGSPEPAAPPAAAPAAGPAEAPAPAETIKMTNLAPVNIGPYTVQPMYEENLADGHFNLKISGGEVAAVREWVGPEDASGVVVVKTEIENDYHHGHVEMPDPIPADARLWIEIETPAGERLKGSTPLN
jgi:catechol 2,3-dioxygenase-like lactoylglutathione lyase family enzyme